MAESFTEMVMSRFGGEMKIWDMLSLVYLLEILEEILSRKMDISMCNSEMFWLEI